MNLSRKSSVVIALGFVLAGGGVGAVYASAGDDPTQAPASAKYHKPDGLSLATHSPYPRTENGLTYGSALGAVNGRAPDLVAAYGDNGTFGFYLSSDLHPAANSLAQAHQANVQGPYTIPLYDLDGETIVASYTINPGVVDPSN